MTSRRYLLKSVVCCRVYFILSFVFSVCLCFAKAKHEKWHCGAFVWVSSIIGHWLQCHERLIFHLYFFVESSGRHSFMPGILQWERLPGSLQRPLCIMYNKSNEEAGLGESIPTMKIEDSEPRLHSSHSGKGDKSARKCWMGWPNWPSFVWHLMRTDFQNFSCKVL